MYIEDTLYSLPTNSFEIYLAGCKPKMIKGKLQHCPACHNKELQTFRKENNVMSVLKETTEKYKNFSNIIDYIWILGGEPLDQPVPELQEMIEYLRLFNKEIVLFTGYSLEYYKNSFDLDIDYLKTGFFDKDNTNTKLVKELNLTLSGDNQSVFKKSLNFKEVF